jgi:hypothetical protein
LTIGTGRQIVKSTLNYPVAGSAGGGEADRAADAGAVVGAVAVRDPQRWAMVQSPQRPNISSPCS